MFCFFEVGVPVLTYFIRALVDDGEQLVGVDQVDEGGDLHWRLGGDEQHAEGNCQLVETVQLSVLMSSKGFFLSKILANLQICNTDLSPPCSP